MKQPLLYAVVPCLNEQENIGHLVDQLKRQSITPIVVDDGSTDNTSKIAKSKAATVIKHQQNRGTGHAIKTGYIYAMKSFENDSIVLVVAGDGQHSPSDAPKLIREITQNKADYAVGERYSTNPKSHGIRASNYVFGKILNLSTSVLTGYNVKDSTCGFTAIKISALRRLRLNFPDRAGETIEMLLECSRNNLRVTFIPITPIFRKKSKISRLTFLTELLVVYIRGIVSEPHSASTEAVLTAASKHT